jgi:predicted methyltransferase
MRIRVLLAAALLTALPLSGALAKDAALAKAVADQHRSPNMVERDKYRHPQEVLEFAGIKPTMTVVEVSPGGGYWTEILGPYLKDKGTYYTAVSARAMENWNKKLADNKAHWGDVKVTEFSKDKYDIAPPGSADLVITSRNVHNWMGAGFAEEAFAAFYKALKPGGTLSVEEHRAPADEPQDPKAADGYVREDHTIELAKKAGFKLVDKSEVLANPKDTKNWPKGVWTLPPTLQMGETDRAKYVAIGEADNFLLKFQKPK